MVLASGSRPGQAGCQTREGVNKSLGFLLLIVISSGSINTATTTSIIIIIITIMDFKNMGRMSHCEQTVKGHKAGKELRPQQEVGSGLGLEAREA